MPFTDHESSLMTREAGGIRVDLCYLPLMGKVALAVQTPDEHRWAEVEYDRALDAFYHPYIYMPDLAPPTR